MAFASFDPGEPGAGYRPLADINVTPFVDVMLVLLIIFMVAAPLMMVGVPVELPRTSAAKLSQPRKPVIVSVSKDGKVFVGERELASSMAVHVLERVHKVPAARRQPA